MRTFILRTEMSVDSMVNHDVKYLFGVILKRSVLTSSVSLIPGDQGLSHMYVSFRV